MYTTINFKTKKQLKTAIDEGQKVGIYSPGPFAADQKNGSTCVEGPWYPEPHRWYATVTLKDGFIVSVK